jgi:hypothetical protein
MTLTETTQTNIDNSGAFRAPQAYKIMNAGDLAQLDIPDEDWIVNELIARGYITILAADSNVGKSMLAQQMGLAIAGGMEEVIGFRIQKPRKVLFINLEMNDGDIQRRQNKMLKILGDNYPSWRKNFQVTKVDGKVLMFDDVWKRIKATILENEPFDLIIVDNLYTSITVDEERNGELKRVLLAMREVADMRNSAILLIAHHKKHNKDRDYLEMSMMRGASSLQNNAHIIFQMGVSTIDKGLVLFRITKNRLESSNLLNTFGISMDPETCWFTNKGNITNPGLHLISNPKRHKDKRLIDDLETQFETHNMRELYQKKGKSRRAADKMLKNLRKRGEIEKLDHGQWKKTELTAVGYK